MIRLYQIFTIELRYNREVYKKVSFLLAKDLCYLNIKASRACKVWVGVKVKAGEKTVDGGDAYFSFLLC